VSSINRILAGISALPVPGGGAFALTDKVQKDNDKNNVILKIFILNLQLA
jgi:hypothetical protein